jgi:surface antigen
LPPHPPRRRGRRGVGWVISVATTLFFVGLAAPSHAIGDDYPYRGLGQCPLVPLPHQPHKPGASAGPHGNAGNHHGPGPHGNGPGKPGQGPGHPAPPAPPPPRKCAQNIWLYNGSYGDPWGFALRNCTSFVAWRLRETNGVADFSNYMDGGEWGNAQHWAQNARALGYLVDGVPAVGAVAQTDQGPKGHVAWVEAVGDGTVTVEEYNYYVAGGYDVRTVPTSDFRYIHVDDVSPDPSLGSSRPASTTVDPLGNTWSASTSPEGTLRVSGPVGSPTRLGAPGSFSTTAAPAVVSDDHGQVWVLAVSREGHLFVAHTAPDSAHWGPVRELGADTWSTTSSPALAVDGQGHLRMIGVTATGDLVERHTSSHRPGGWSAPARMGLPGSWATHAAPAAAMDGHGRVWVVAVTQGGGLLSRHTTDEGRRWTSLRPVDDRSWSVTSSPALSRTDDGRLWLASVTDRGTLVLRHTQGSDSRWHPATELSGAWSPYASPSFAEDSTGLLWLAAVDQSGQVHVGTATTSDGGWRQERRLYDSGVTHSPTLTAPRIGGVTLGTDGTGGTTHWHPVVPGLQLDGSGTRPGGFVLVLLG